MAESLSRYIVDKIERGADIEALPGSLLVLLSGIGDKQLIYETACLVGKYFQEKRKHEFALMAFAVALKSGHYELPGHERFKPRNDAEVSAFVLRQEGDKVLANYNEPTQFRIKELINGDYSNVEDVIKSAQKRATIK